MPQIRPQLCGRTIGRWLYGSIHHGAIGGSGTFLRDHLKKAFSSMTGYVAFCFPTINVTNADGWMPKLTEFSQSCWQNDIVPALSVQQ